MKPLFIMLLAVLQFTSVDNDFKYETDYEKCRKTLQQMLPQAQSGKEKAEVFWRLSRVCLVLGENEENVSVKRSLYKEGMEYAAKGMKEDPYSVNCYMWHCANIGRECQTRSLMEQAAAVPDMTKDLTMILDKLGATGCSEAWQALSEMYWHHPFKSDESAINYARKAATSIPSDELRISTYTYLAELLYKRDWNSSKRTSEAKSNASRFSKKSGSNIERYAYYDGAGEKMPWCSSPFTALSDKEEADAIISYAQSLYSRCGNPTPVDKEDYKSLTELTKNK